MAYEAMENLRQAELSAIQQIESEIKKADEAFAKAKENSQLIISKAQKEAELRLESSRDKASNIAEEIIVTAQNNAVLEAEKLSIKSAERQDEINKAVISLLSDAICV